ncbi:MAG: hypothetical protein Q9225_004349 [Loekoesia sp. 1 TL-2023]
MKAAVPPGQMLDLYLLEIDLGDFKCVKDAAERFQQHESKLYLLVNNAGVMALPYKLTANGFETYWQTNHLAPHLLFTLLLPMMRSTAAASKSRHAVRVINVASDATFLNGPKELDLVNPNLESARGAMTCWQIPFFYVRSGSVERSKVIWSIGAGMATQRLPVSFMPGVFMIDTPRMVTSPLSPPRHLENESPSWGSHFHWIIDPDHGESAPYGATTGCITNHAVLRDKS